MSRFVIFLCGGLCGALLAYAASSFLGSSGGVPADTLNPAPVRPSVTPPAPPPEYRALQAENRELARQITEMRPEVEAYRAQLAEEAAQQEQAKVRFLENALPEFGRSLNLTPLQAQQIGELLWERHNSWLGMMRGERPWDAARLEQFEESVRAVLSLEQQELYALQQEREHENNATIAATAVLGRYPAELDLSEPQKDALFQNLYQLHHPQLRENFSADQAPADLEGVPPQSRFLLQAAEGVLSPEQLEQLRQSLQSGG